MLFLFKTWINGRNEEHYCKCDMPHLASHRSEQLWVAQVKTQILRREGGGVGGWEEREMIDDDCEYDGTVSEPLWRCVCKTAFLTSFYVTEHQSNTKHSQITAIKSTLYNPLSEANSCATNKAISQYFVIPDGVIPSTQETATGLCTESAHSSQNSSIFFR
jgi:hypothetical protein